MYNNINITSSPSACQPPSCNITLQNHCNENLTSENCFDLVSIDVEGYPTTLSYYVICDAEYSCNGMNWSYVI